MNKLKIAFITLLILLSAVFTATKVLAAASFQGGNVFIVSNTNTPGWTDPVNAQVTDVVEFKVDITNIGPDTMATNVQVKADFPTNVSGNTIAATIHVRADNAPEITDTATVNVTNADPAGTRHLVYFPGHATIIAHPGNVTSSLEAIGGGGWVNVGNLSSQNNSFIEVLYKAQITQSTPLASPAPSVAPSPSPSPAPSVAPSPSPSPAPSVAPSPSPAPPSQGGVVQCPAGTTATTVDNIIICIQNQNQNTNTNTQTQTNNQNVNVTQTQNPAPAAAPAAPAVAGVKVTQLPKTGLPAFLALGLAGLLPLGMKLRKTFSVKEELSNHPTYMWEQREFKKAL